MRPLCNPAGFLMMFMVLAGSACESDKPKPEPKPENAAIDEVVQAPLFQGDQVTLPPQFAGLEFGMTLAEAQAVVPSMDEHGRIPYDGTPRAILSAEFAATIKGFKVLLPDTDLVAQLTERWGPPHERSYFGRKLLRWFNPEAGLRAEVQTYENKPMSSVEFTRYQPLATFLGDGPTLAFQTNGPLLGMTPTELDAAYGEGLTPYFKEQIRERGAEAVPSALRLPSTTEWESETQLSIGWQNGKLNLIEIRLGYPDDPAGKAEIMALLVKKWGEATELEGQPKTWVFAQHPNIRVEDDDEMQVWSVEVMSEDGLPTR